MVRISGMEQVPDIGQVPFQALTTDKNAADRIAASIDILGRRMNHDVSSKLQWLDQIRGCYRIVYDQWYVMLMCHFCNRLDIGNVQLGFPIVSAKQVSFSL